MLELFGNSLDFLFSLLLLGYSAEISLYFLSATDYFSNPPANNSSIEELSDTTSSYVLNLLGLVFAGFIFLINNENISHNSLRFFFTAIGLLFLSFQSRNLTGLARIFFVIQDKSLSYGVIALFLGLIVLAIEIQLLGAVALYVFFVIISFLYLVEAKVEYAAYIEEASQNSG